MRIKQLFIYFAFLFTGALFYTCSKTGDIKPQDTFFKEYGNWAYPVGVQKITQTANNGFLIVGNGGPKSLTPFIIHISNSGDLISSKLLSDDPYSCDQFLAFFDGSFYGNNFNNSGYVDYISKFDSTGKVVAANQIYIHRKSTYSCAPPVAFSNGNIATSLCNGIDQAGQTFSYVLRYDQNLKLLDSTYFSGAYAVSGHTLTFNVYHPGPDKYTYYTYGLKFPTWNGANWNSNVYLYAAIAYSYKTWKLTLIDSADRFATYFHEDHLVTKDTGLVLLGVRTDNSNGGYRSASVSYIDKDMNLIWHHIFEEPGSSLVPFSIGNCKDGGYIISGEASVGSSSYKPYVLRLDKNGNKLWSRIYSFPGTGWFGNGIELENGGFLFAGGSAAFGNGNSVQVIVLKTDENGNY